MLSHYLLSGFGSGRRFARVRRRLSATLWARAGARRASGRVSERVKWTGVNDSFSCCQECRRWRRRKTSQSTVSPGTTARKRRKNVDTGNLQHDSTSLFTYDNNTNRLQLFVLYNTVQFKNNFTLRDLFTSCTMEIDISNWKVCVKLEMFQSSYGSIHN